MTSSGERPVPSSNQERAGHARRKGTLTTWNDTRGYGYITPRDGGATVFVHIKGFSGRSSRPEAGSSLSFEMKFHDGKPQAANVRIFAEAIVVDDAAHAEQGTPEDVAAVKRMRAVGAPKRRGLAYVMIPVFVALCIAISLRWGANYWLFGIYPIASFVTYFAYAADKSAAQAGSWRTSEKTLVLLGTLGGWPGAIIAQERLRHKTRRVRFQIIFWLSVVLNIFVLVALVRSNQR